MDEDPCTYKGSGVGWQEHLKEHGEDVTTKVLFESDDQEGFVKFISEELDIVNSEEFANRTHELGKASGEKPEARFTDQLLVKLRPELKKDFAAVCESQDENVSFVILSLMKAYI